MPPTTQQPGLPPDFFHEIEQRAHAYPLPPPDFDRFAVTNAQLETYGIPARPDPELEPELFQYWNWLLAEPFNVITPEFPEPRGRDLPVVPLYRVGRGGRRSV